MIKLENSRNLCMGCHRLMEHPGGFCEFCGHNNEQPASPHHLPPYTVLAGKYMVGRVLGEGGFGITYLGYDLNLQIKVAVKEYYPAGNVSRESTRSNSVYPVTNANANERYQAGLERFLNEARAIARFHNLSGIVEVRDFFRENGTAYIVMEFLEGRTLAKELKERGRIPAGEVLSRFEPMIRSLSQVHKEGIIHRDISPDNIMSDAEGRLKLLDFGAAKEINGEVKSVSVMLKPGYAPEEQYRIHGNQGPWTDCYALCATLYKLMTGVTPPESLDRLAEDTLQPPTQLGADLTDVQEKAIIMGMSVRMEDRFKSVDALYNALYFRREGNQPAEVQARATRRTKTVQTENRTAFGPAAVYTPKKQKSALPLIIAIVLACLAVAGLCLYFLVFNKPAPVYQPVATALPEEGRIADRFKTPEPTPVVEQPAVPDADAVRAPVPSYSAFTGAELINEESADGLTTYYYITDETDLWAYYGMLEAMGEYTFTYPEEDDGLFCAEKDGITVSFHTVDGYLAISMPEGMDIDGFTAPVDHQYLLNNGMTYQNWLDTADSVYGKEGDNYRGNTPANINAQSCVAVQGDYLYFCEYTDSGYLYRQPVGGGKSEVILEEPVYAMHLSAAGDYLYFTCYSESKGYRSIYRIKIDGDADGFELIRENATLPIAMGDYVCFKNNEDNTYMRMLADGSEPEVICGGDSYFPNVLFDDIYVCDTEQGIGLYAVDPETFEQTLVMDEDMYSMMVCDDFVYYVAGEDRGYALYRYDLMIEKEIMLTDIAAKAINTDGDNLFIETEEGFIYMLPMDGGEATRIARDASNLMVISNGDVTRLFYLVDDGMELVEYDLKTGTEKTFLP